MLAGIPRLVRAANGMRQGGPHVLLAAAFGLVLAAFVLGPAPAPAAVYNPESFTLSNGLKVVVIENHRSPVVRQMVFYKVGSADDPPGKSGLAHYLEHLMFKGTKTVGPNAFSKIVARNGGHENAFTVDDMTAYYQTVAKDRFPLVMKYEADRMQNLRIVPKQAVPELQVVLEEQRMRIANRPAAQFEEQMEAALFLHYPYQIPVIGWKKEIEGLTAADAIAFYKRYYAPNNAILVISGDVTVEEVRPLAEKYYGPIPSDPGFKPRTRVKEPPHRAALRVTFHSDQVREPSFRRDYIAPSRAYGKTGMADALEVLSVILGGGTSNRLYRSLVVEQKVALSADAFYDADVLGPATFGFALRPAAGVSMKKVEDAFNAEIKKLLTGGITAQELAHARSRLLASAVFARDNLRTGAMAIGTALCTGQTIKTVETWPERIKAVTVDQVEAAARYVLRPAKSVTGLLLPTGPASQRKKGRPSPPAVLPSKRGLTR